MDLRGRSEPFAAGPSKVSLLKLRPEILVGLDHVVKNLLGHLHGRDRLVERERLERLIRVGQILREELHDLVDALPDVVPAALRVAVLLALVHIRAFEDGDKVFLQTVYNFAGAGEQVAFDIFRFNEKDLIAEHWDNLAEVAGPNPSGRTQTDGATEAADLDRTEENRALVEAFLVDVMQGKHPEKTPEYFAGDAYLQHNIGIADGLSGLGAALEALAAAGIQMVYDKTHQVLAQGNFVLGVSEGTFGGKPTSYYDLWRVEDGKIAEHWDVMETIADLSDWQNENGKF